MSGWISRPAFPARPARPVRGAFMKRVLLATVAVGIASAALVAQRSSREADGDWPLYSRDLAGTKYSPLTQVTANNVAKLTQVWTVRVAPPAGRRGGAAPADGAAPAAAGTPAAAPGRGAQAAAGN